MPTRHPARFYMSRHPLRLRATLLTVTALTTPTIALAQAADDPYLLDEITITASGFEQLVEDAPASVSVISGEELAKGSVTSLSDALEQVQGVVTTGQSNSEDIYIRGLSGQYTLILVDGKRQGTRESRVNGSAGFEQSFIPPVSAIERIEVVRGPMSSLYGSDAMGGVVNIITKPVADVWSGSVTAEFTVPQDDKYSSTRQQSFYLSGPLIRDTIGLQLWGRNLDRSEAEVIGGLQGRDLQDVGARLSYAINPDHKIYLEGSITHLEDTGRIGKTIEDIDDFNGNPYTDTFQENKRRQAVLSYSGNWGATTADLSYSRETGRRMRGSGDGTGGFIYSDRAPKIENRVFDAKFNTPVNWNGEHRLTYGGQYFDARLFDQNPGLQDGQTYRYSAAQWAVFAEDEWQIRDDFALTLGLRYNDHEEFGSHVTPRIYAVWNATQALTIKGGISTGYRAPDLRSVVPGYYYTTQRGAGVIVSNPDLNPEESTNIELAALYHGGNFELGGTLFRTRFENKIESRNTDTPIVVDGNTYNRWEFYNVGKARLQGVELTGRWDITDDVLVRANYTYTDSEQLTGDYRGLPLERTPKHMLNLRGEWITPVDGLDSWAALNYHGKEVNAGARTGTNGTPTAWDSDGNVLAYEYDAYTTVDIGANYRVSDYATLNAAIYNLFDKELIAADANTVLEGRSFWVGLTAEF
ncbi:TonB-dependent receptor domain-containing protein [Paracoccus fistulariae]|uniref:TonB-dependent receptor n=1 Tax=Paracoccus fistulariae TaxID=658446 RepID=A0ABY7SJS0_9RHOB|nr:TonB-dependent receptor [Paracoccus fistulariae]MDB6181972.1 TonB-dependent receptor [Paracoccus fistulariae]WCR06792.1 TonB-dependent receptor [Paracoccus fistulariae]